MWSDAFLTQAGADWQIFEHLYDSDFPECHALHYLQMATEKLAKAYLLAGPTDIETVGSTHRALIRFLQDISRNRGLQEEMVMTAAQLRAHVKQLLPLAFEIEKLAPKLAAGGPNPEYPWEAPKGTFCVPATYEFSISQLLLEPRGHHLIRLIKIALKKFHVLH
jgi:hypothetical protein